MGDGEKRANRISWEAKTNEDRRLETIIWIIKRLAQLTMARRDLKVNFAFTRELSRN